MSLLSVEKLFVKYHESENWSLKDINFDFDRGKLIVIAGASGSGKTTLAQSIMGLIPLFYPAELTGDIRINGTLIHNISRSEMVKLIGYVPQYPGDYTTSLLVEEEIAFPLENNGIEGSQIQDKITEVLQKLRISHLRERLITELSSGELQRVALATSLTLNPPILILDEPIARIDPKSEIMLVDILKNLAKENKLVLAFEHRLDYLLASANALLFLENGNLIAQGKPDDMIHRIKGIDLPEVSKINLRSNKGPALSINEALSLFQARNSMKR